MTKGINKRLKKSISLAVTSIMVTLSISTTAFASPVFYTSEEGIGIEVNLIEVYDSLSCENKSILGRDVKE